MRSRNLILNGVTALVLLCTTLSCMPVRYLVNPPSDGSGQFSPSKEHREDERYAEWCYNFPDYIIPRICAYYQLHPERFKPTGKGEEVEVEGFFEFVKNDGYFKSPNRASVWTGKIKDPWGDPVHFVQDLNMDGYIEAGGERGVVFDPTGQRAGLFTNQLNFGVFKQRSYKGPDGNPRQRIFARPCH